jgi:prenylcysteine oxidase / farnesylcysteine lyase
MKPIELGASIFVRANKNLWRASDEFNLTRLDFEDEDSDMGIWDGQEFLLTVRPLSLADSADFI